MKLEILSPNKYLFNGEAEEVTLPGSGGVFSVKDHHVALISTLKAGQVKVILSSGDEKEFEINDGVIEVKANAVVVCVNE
jgi:F-type H+-transporting ATPase subunit epsilon